MRADKGHHEDSGAESGARASDAESGARASGTESGARTGPRHAAPKKPFLTRLQVPAGKAIALAAMPTAVLMGMGLTPTLAQAKPLPKNPFQDGPCVTQPDESPEDAQQRADGADSTKDADDRSDAARDDAETAKPSASPSASPEPSDSPRPEPSEPAPSPSGSGAAGSGGLLGGLGGALGDILTPGQRTSAQPSPSPSVTAQPSDRDAASAADKVTETVGDTVDKVTGSAKEVTDGVADVAEDAVEPSPSASNPMAPDEEGKKPFPCVVEKKSAGTDETTPVVLPNQPWRLEASSLLLQGLDYVGVVNVTMANGQTKQALKFTADDGIDIGDLHQLVDGPGGKTYHVQAAEGSTSTIRGGRVTLYTERLEGNLFGLIPITFDPEHPPPVNVPVAYFTNVKLVQAGQFGGDLTVPGLHQFMTD